MKTLLIIAILLVSTAAQADMMDALGRIYQSDSQRLERDTQSLKRSMDSLRNSLNRRDHRNMMLEINQIAQRGTLTPQQIYNIALKWGQDPIAALEMFRPLLK